MTTGRINQVAFLTDSAARMGRAPNGGGASFARSAERLLSGANRGRGPRTHRVFRIREIGRRRNGPATRARAAVRGTWDTAGALRSTPRRGPEGCSAGRKRDVWDNGMPSPIGMQHRKPTAAKAGARLGRRLKRLAGDVVAARAGIQHAHTRQSPLTRPLRTKCPSRQANARRPTTHSSVAAVRTAASTPKHAPGRHEDSGRSTSWEPRSTKPRDRTDLPVRRLHFRRRRATSKRTLKHTPAPVREPCMPGLPTLRQPRATDLGVAGQPTTTTTPALCGCHRGDDGRVCKPSPAALDASMFAGNGLLASAPKIGIADTSPTTSY
ncbi:UNVERIFIED_CONTAM: hypothetical protein Sindi_2645700 [Sesamum indicum]